MYHNQHPHTRAMLEAINSADVSRREPHNSVMDAPAPSHGGAPNIDPTDQFETNPITQTEPPAGSAQYGSQVSPNGPRQDMYQVDVLTGGPVLDRTASPAEFTGGDGGAGLGGMANPQSTGEQMGGTVHERTGI